MKLKILSFSGESFSSENVKSVTLMTGIGEITILEGHTALLTSVKPSTMFVVYIDETGNEKREDFAIGSGVVEVNHSIVKIMADMLVDIDDLDIGKAETAKEEALKIMAEYKDAKDKVDMDAFIDAQDMLLKSLAQLKLSESLNQ